MSDFKAKMHQIRFREGKGGTIPPHREILDPPLVVYNAKHNSTVWTVRPWWTISFDICTDFAKSAFDSVTVHADPSYV